MIFKAKKPEYPALYILLACALLLGVALRLYAYYVPKQDTPDEKTYILYANRQLDRGLLDAVKENVLIYNNVEYWRWYPVPTRLGYTTPEALKIKLLGKDFEYQPVISLLCSVLTLLLLAYAAYCHFGIAGAYVVSLVQGTFLPSIDIARRIWPESMTEFLCAALFISALLILKRGKVLTLYSLPYLLFGVYFFYVKDSYLLILFICSLPPFVYFLYQRKFLEALLMFLLGVSLIILGLSSLASLSGGFDLLVETYKLHTEAHSMNQYAIDYQSGDWTMFFKIFYTLAPGTSLLLLAFSACWYFRAKVFSEAVKKELNKYIFVLALLLFIFLIYISAASLAHNYKNFRLFAPIFPLISVFISLPLILLLKAALSSRFRLAFYTFNIAVILCLLLNYPVFVEYLNTAVCGDQTLRLIIECLAV